MLNLVFTVFFYTLVCKTRKRQQTKGKVQQTKKKDNKRVLQKDTTGHDKTRQRTSTTDTKDNTHPDAKDRQAQQHPDHF
jgi:hypothetical protein